MGVAGETEAEEEEEEEGMRAKEEEGTEGTDIAEVCTDWAATGTAGDEGVFGVAETLSELFVADGGVSVCAEDRADVLTVFACRGRMVSVVVGGAWSAGNRGTGGRGGLLLGLLIGCSCSASSLACSVVAVV